MEKLLSKNPTTGEIIRELDVTSIDSLPEIFQRARVAQEKWSALSPRKRAGALISLRETIINQIDDLAALIAQENGKPLFEAMMNELFPSVELITYFAKKAPRILKDQVIHLGLMKHRTSYLNYWPLGTVAVISPWNYPFMLPFCEIVMALAAGNAVVFKPSEVTPVIGLKIQQLCEEAGLPSNIVQTLIGGPELGAALIEQKPAKIFFTGSVPTGKKIMAAASKHLIPVNLELGGNDAMIILADADLDYATSAALWGGFSNSGQVCASVKRILVHESIASSFVEQLKAKVTQLAATDLGAITFERQKDIYASQIDEAKSRGATFVTGGEFSANRTSLAPTIVTGPQIESMDIYNNESFGPIVAVTTFNSVDQAIQKANHSRYGLLASVITKNLGLAEVIAKQLQVGTVTINEVVYTAGLPETPWGGLKDSGFGRTHSQQGLLEFVNVRHIHKPKSLLFVFKSLWWFPYTPHQYATFRQLFEVYRKGSFAKIKAIPLLLWNFVHFMKKEKRL